MLPVIYMLMYMYTCMLWFQPDLHKVPLVFQQMQRRDEKRRYSENYRDDEHRVNSYGFVENYDNPSDIVMSRGIRHMKDRYPSTAPDSYIG